jgi:hypothetical protein
MILCELLKYPYRLLDGSPLTSKVIYASSTPSGKNATAVGGKHSGEGLGSPATPPPDLLPHLDRSKASITSFTRVPVLAKCILQVGLIQIDDLRGRHGRF